MHLRDSALAAGRWTVSSQLIRALLQLVQTMVLARMLVPGDFGLMAIVVAVYSIIALFADMGVSSALMHMSVPSRKALSTLFFG